MAPILHPSEVQDYFDAKQAGSYLDVTPGTARAILSKPDAFVALSTGHKIMLWSKERVQKAKEMRSGKPRRDKKIYWPEDKYVPTSESDFEVNEFGHVIKRKQTFRGSICRYKGCKEPVPTGMLFCSKHRSHFKSLQKQCATHPDTYTFHPPKY